MPDTPIARQFRLYRTRAAVLLGSADDLRALAMRATRKLATASGLRLHTVKDDLSAFVALLKAYADGSYREVSNSALIAVAAAVLYFVVPLDLVPDVILGLGLVDDAAIIGYVVKMVRRELDAFAAWQRDKESQ